MKNILQRRNILTVVIPAVIVLLTAITIVAVQSKSSVKAPEPTVAVGTIQVKGTALCLPHKNTDGPQTMECALGLKDEKGNYYALSDTDPSYKNVGSIPMNEPLVITGTLVKGESDLYPTIGTLKVIKITG